MHKKVAFGFMVRFGCRSQEVVYVRPIDVHQRDEISRWYLRIPSVKGGKERRTPMRNGLANMIRAVSGEIAPDSSVVNGRTGTHDRWRTWGRPALEAKVLHSVMMQWGGWENYETLQNYYFRKHSESVQDREAEKVDWL